MIRANPAEPFLYVQLDLAPDRIAALTPRVFPHGLPKAADYSALDTHDTPPEIVDAVVRLMQLIAHPDDIDLLAPLIVDEILIRLLRVRRVHASRRSVGRFDDAAHLARRRLDTRPLPRPDDGRIACAAGGHGRRPSITTSVRSRRWPLQCQKVLRLQEARRLMCLSAMDARQACRSVGYVSASQFSREYARLFGDAPGRDVLKLRDEAVPLSRVAP